ncbi:LysR family transcriptional regulator [Marilutibacter alkalisoli]|uniref:LysR family transcriptional regulator n=1 Tax=Marilutibacter alkalisoli TaxID=2591633 RepID=A0A514BMW8_9GAMM|nr:LysR family transcriptional regulator [Lysobacter alkalisoli]QDH68733.1 LysR family transcriptional regulator [Lysobacter alkalisoli]
MSTIPLEQGPSLDLAGLLAFVRVAELGSFVRASESLGLSKAAVSKQVSALERRLGARLLHRTTRRLSLTEAGQAYLRHAQAALSQARAAEDAVADTQTVARGRLRVAVPMSFGLLHIAPLASAFLREQPQVDLDLQFDDRPQDLVAAGLDLAIRFSSRLDDSSLVARRLGRVRVGLFAAPAYLDRHGRPGHPDQLTGHDCLHYSLTPGGYVWEMSRAGETIRVAVAARLEANSSLALRAAVLGGGGIARLPEFVVGGELSRGELEGVLPEWRFPALDMYAVMPERRYVPAKVRVFLDFLTRSWAQSPGWDMRR